MLKIVEKLDNTKYTPRIYIHGETDKISVEKLHEKEKNNKDWKIIPIFRSREVGQSYLTSIVTTLIAFRDAFYILFAENPDLILCNGPGTGVPLCLGSFLMQLLFINKSKVIFIESFCRVKTFSLTGKILYHFVDHVIVQWPNLCTNNDKHCIMTNKTPLTSIEIPWNILLQVCNEQLPLEIKAHLIPMCNTLQTHLISNGKIESIDVDDLLLIAEACLDRTWEELNTGHWKNVPIEQRHCYTVCSILKCITLEIKIGKVERVNEELTVKEIITQIDKGLLLGAPLDEAPNILTEMASRLNEHIRNQENIAEVLDFDVDCVSKELLPGFKWLKRFNSPSMESFYRDIFMPKCPVVLTGCIKHWKALKTWKDPNYLIKIAGSRTVPIELGSRYTEEDWSQCLTTFSEFIRSHVIKTDGQIGYLAQHQLFDQIPELKADFSVPEYCNFSDNENETYPDINAWFGPKGTVSPLHYDPKNNLLCQVFGCKQIILYHPDDQLYLYPYDTKLLSNTAEVDPLNPKYDKFPEFKKATGYMCYLHPGEMLYIPPKWWHYVVSLTPSFSISFWW
ncbi:hypothetical protein PV326_011037, partial [Microctonus aethiopoides]